MLCRLKTLGITVNRKSELPQCAEHQCFKILCQRIYYQYTPMQIRASVIASSRLISPFASVADIVAELRSNSDGCSHDGKCIADGERSVSVRIAAENDCDIIYAVIGVDINPVAVIFIKENAIAEKTGSSMETHSRRGRMVLNSFFTIYSLKVIVHDSDWRIA